MNVAIIVVIIILIIIFMTKTIYKNDKNELLTTFLKTTNVNKDDFLLIQTNILSELREITNYPIDEKILIDFFTFDNKSEEIIKFYGIKQWIFSAENINLNNFLLFLNTLNYLNIEKCKKEINKKLSLY